MAQTKEEKRRKVLGVLEEKLLKMDIQYAREVSKRHAEGYRWNTPMTAAHWSLVWEVDNLRKKLGKSPWYSRPEVG